MRNTLIVCIASLAGSLSAQSFYIPTNTPTVGTANAFPFNTTNMRYQALLLATDLNSTPALITGFSLAPSASGFVRLDVPLVRRLDRLGHRSPTPSCLSRR